MARTTTAHALDYENGTMYAQTCTRCGAVRSMRAGRGGWTMVWRLPDGTEKRGKTPPPCVVTSKENSMSADRPKSATEREGERLGWARRIALALGALPTMDAAAVLMVALPPKYLRAIENAVNTGVKAAKS